MPAPERVREHVGEDPKPRLEVFGPRANLSDRGENDGPDRRAVALKRDGEHGPETPAREGLPSGRKGVGKVVDLRARSTIEPARSRRDGVRGDGQLAGVREPRGVAGDDRMLDASRAARTENEDRRQFHAEQCARFFEPLPDLGVEVCGRHPVRKQSSRLPSRRS